MVIYLFRKDLRIQDNIALQNALSHDTVLPVFIFDKNFFSGLAETQWLRQSLLSLQESFANKIALFAGDTHEVLLRLIKKYKVSAVYTNREYSRYDLNADIIGIPIERFNNNLLWDPEKRYEIFTPFYKYYLEKDVSLCQQVKLAGRIFHDDTMNYNVDAIELPDSVNAFPCGELKAMKRFKDFHEIKSADYKENKHMLDVSATSKLSVHLNFGEISPRMIFHSSDRQGEFVRQLIWREFAHHMFFYHRDLDTKNLRREYDYFEWSDNEEHLAAWQSGNTGYPIVDAAQRQLLREGYVHNRARLIAASFLVKNLRIHWKHGADWYQKHLLDFDIASNSMNWQWVAGTGVDAAPYFRIFNPFLQQAKFDPQRKYINYFLEAQYKSPPMIVDFAESKAVFMQKHQEMKIKAEKVFLI